MLDLEKWDNAKVEVILHPEELRIIKEALDTLSKEKLKNKKQLWDKFHIARRLYHYISYILNEIARSKEETNE